MKENFIVSQATIHELDEFADLFDQYRMFYHQESDPEGAKAFLLERFKYQQSTIFLVREESTAKAVGFTQLYPSFSSISMTQSWILNDLFVLPDYRRKGVGSILLNTAQYYALHTRSKELILSTASDNIPAQKLYEEFGFVKDQDFYHYILGI